MGWVGGWVGVQVDMGKHARTSTHTGAAVPGTLKAVYTSSVIRKEQLLGDGVPVKADRVAHAPRYELDVGAVA